MSEESKMVSILTVGFVALVAMALYATVAINMRGHQSEDHMHNAIVACAKAGRAPLECAAAMKR